jgi:hypothetical protein
MDVDVQDTTDVEMGMRPMDEEDDNTIGKSGKRMQVGGPVSVMVKMRHWRNA